MIENIDKISIKEFCNDNHLNYYTTLIFITEQIRKIQELLNRKLTNRELVELIEMAKTYIIKEIPEELKLK